MDTLVASAIEQARNRLTPLLKLTLNTLAVACATGDTQIELADEPQGVTAGSFIALGTEVMFVPTVPSGRIVSVYRAQLGTSKPASAATHAAGTIVESKTRFPRGLILQALLEEVRSLGPDLYQPKLKTLSGSSGVAGYDLGLADWTEIYDILRMYVAPESSDTTSQSYRRLDGRYIPIGPLALCSTGNAALMLNGPLPSDRTVSIEYAAPFDTDPFTVATDLVADCKMAPSMFDVAWLGATYRMLQEAPRTQLATQPEPRKAEEVPAGLITAVRADLFKEYQRRKQEEMQKLLRRYPR